MGKYDYLLPFVNNRNQSGERPKNWFMPVDWKVVERAEQLLREELPSQLKEFYKEIGYGSLKAPFNAPDDYQDICSNYIQPPISFCDLIENGEDNEFMTPGAYEDLEPGDLPFFEIGDSSSFLVMKLNSDNPNAVWSVFGIPITDSFEEFIWRLYYESPDFYDDIVTQYWDEVLQMNGIITKT